MALLSDEQADSVISALVEIGKFLPVAAPLAAVLGPGAVAAVAGAGPVLTALEALAGALKGKDTLEAAAEAARAETVKTWTDDLAGTP